MLDSLQYRRSLCTHLPKWPVTIVTGFISNIAFLPTALVEQQPDLLEVQRMILTFFLLLDQPSRLWAMKILFENTKYLYNKSNQDVISRHGIKQINFYQVLESNILCSDWNRTINPWVRMPFSYFAAWLWCSCSQESIGGQKSRSRKKRTMSLGIQIRPREAVMVRFHCMNVCPDIAWLSC